MRPALLSGLIGRSQAQFPAAGLLGSLFVDEIAPQADGTAVASWVDPRSGLVAAQATPSARPIYRTNRLGAMPALQFTGGQYLNAGTPPALIAAMVAGTVSIMVIYAGIQPASNAALFCATTGQTNSWLLQADGTRVGRYNGGNLSAQPPHSGAGFTSMLYTVADVSAFAPEPRLERVFINGGCAAANFGMGVTPNDAVGLGGRADDGALGLVGDVFSALSQLANAVVLAGDPNESICGRCYRQSWIVPMKVLDFLLSPFSKGHHCRGAFNQDRSWALKAAQWPDRIVDSEKHL